MDRTSACGAEDPGSIPGERTNFPSYVRAALTAALLFPGSAAAEFGSADGVLALEERPGWSTAEPKPGSVISLRNGAGAFTLSPAPDEAAPFALVVAQGVRLRRAGTAVSEPESRTTLAGLPYLVSAASVPGRPTPELLGALVVDKTRYSFSVSGVPLEEGLALLDSLDRLRPPEEPAPPPEAPAGPAEAFLFGGEVRLPRPKDARLAPQADGWVVAVGKRWSLGAWDGGPDGGPGGPEFLRLRGAELETRRSCRGGDAVAHPLANGWTATLRPFICPDALPGMVVVIGTVDRGRRGPLYLAGDYGTVAGQDQFVAWLASATEALRPKGPSWPATSFDRGTWAWIGLAAASVGLLAMAVSRR